MKNFINKKLIIDCIKKNSISLILFFIISLINLIILFLYHIILEPFIYAEVINFTVLIFLLIIDYSKLYIKNSELIKSRTNYLIKFGGLPTPQDSVETEYQKLIQQLQNTLNQINDEYLRYRSETEDYYSVWVHQIKIPISVLKLKIPENDFETQYEIQRIEQYVDMVLEYMRIESTTNDLLIKEYSLDEIIRESIRKFAAQFILKKINLEYIPFSRKITTDKKWFQFIIDQILSNAIKYTPTGIITIKESNDFLMISDTGIGIAEEDIPRIFEKGYTGINGRTGRYASGIGLFLVHKASEKLNLKINVKSQKGKGTTFSVDLSKII